MIAILNRSFWVFAGALLIAHTLLVTMVSKREAFICIHIFLHSSPPALHASARSLSPSLSQIYQCIRLAGILAKPYFSIAWHQLLYNELKVTMARHWAMMKSQANPGRQVKAWLVFCTGSWIFFLFLNEYMYRRFLFATGIENSIPVIDNRRRRMDEMEK